MRASLQRRLFGILGVFVLAITGLWAGLSLMLAYIVEDEIVDRVLATEIAVLQDNYNRTGELSAPMLPEVAIYPALDAVPESLQAHIESHVGGEIFTPGDTHYHYRWLQLPQRAPLLLVAEVSPWLVVSRMSTPLFVLLITGFAVALLFSLVAAFQISRITTRPLRELTAAIEQQPRPSPLPHVDQGDEVGVLAAAMESALAGLQQALERETSFTHDVSHELRTPLTSLRNAISLLPQELGQDANVAQLRSSSAAIESLLTALLALARAESTLATDLPLRAMLEAQLLRLGEPLEQGTFRIELEVPDSATVHGNEQLAHLLLANLIDNAVHYASPAELRIYLENGELAFANPVGDRPADAHPDSLGHGLSLVHRLAQAQQWQFTAEQRDGVFLARLSF